MRLNFGTQILDIAKQIQKFRANLTFFFEGNNVQYESRSRQSRQARPHQRATKQNRGLKEKKGSDLKHNTRYDTTKCMYIYAIIKQSNMQGRLVTWTWTQTLKFTSAPQRPACSDDEHSGSIRPTKQKKGELVQFE